MTSMAASSSPGEYIVTVVVNMPSVKDERSAKVGHLGRAHI